MTCSGTALASAFIVAFQARKQASIRARTGAGWRGLRSEPSGAVTVMARLLPSLNGMSGLVSTALTQLSAAETVEEKGELRLRATWAQVPAKSMATRSPEMVTVER